MIESNYFYLVFALMFFGTLVIRGSFIFFSNRISISTSVRELFSYIPAAVFPALIAPAAFFHSGKVPWLFDKERFVVLVLAGVVCYYVRNTFVVISFGLGLLFILHIL
jgi:branched-subunit amino acid transport protein